MKQFVLWITVAVLMLNRLAIAQCPVNSGVTVSGPVGVDRFIVPGTGAVVVNIDVPTTTTSQINITVVGDGVRDIDSITVDNPTVFIPNLFIWGTGGAPP